MKVLLLPVSAARGFGEYARAREIAAGIQRRWPDAQLHFVLSRQAPYARACPFPATLLPGSATLHTPEVVELIGRFKPDIAIFDNAGRTAQIRAAQAAGARVIYVSSRRRQRGKAFRWRWMRLLDEHWIAYPVFIAGDLTLLESWKLRLLGRPAVRFIDTVLPAVSAPDAVLPQRRDFVLVVAGGGTAHPGAGDAPQVIAAAATALADQGLATILVGVAEPGEIGQLIRLPLLPAAQLLDLMRRSRIVVCNGGDTLMQALACACACVAVPIAHDQHRRIVRCAGLRLIHSSALEAVAIVSAVTALQNNPEERERLIARGRAAGITDALPRILDWIGSLAGQAAS